MAEVLHRCRVTHCHSLGTLSVPVGQIRGSEGRCRDFDQAFYPTQFHTYGRWMSIATILLLGSDLPAVDLIKVGNIYFVRDGHHRISVARQLGASYIDAHVMEWKVSGQIPWEEVKEEVRQQRTVESHAG
jgi:hypothetical protein